MRKPRDPKVIKKSKSKNKSDLGPNFVAPDGNWGWIVCVAAGISNFSTFPVLQQFGLIFRDKLTNIGLTGPELTTLINIQASLSSCTGLLNGPLFRKWSYRQVAVCGSLLVIIGLFLIGFSESFLAYCFTFSIMYGIGMGFNLSATTIVLNTYFKAKRRYAMGLAWTITGIGPIIMPYISNSLLDVYGTSGTVIIFSAISMHAIVCSMTYQPVMWHAKQTADIELNKIKQIPNQNEETQNLMVKERILEHRSSEMKVRNSVKSRQTKFWKNIVLFFDLDLLNDYTYLILMIGLITANFTEMNYSILTPFILNEFGLSQNQIALSMSLQAGVDISMRFLIPFLLEKIKWQNKTFYLLGVLGMALGRIIIAHVHIFYVVLIASAWIGFNKALRTIFMGIVIPSYVPLNRVPAATGLQLMFSGLFTLAMGPVIGLIRDSTNYTITLHALNIGTYFTVILWIGMILCKKENLKNESNIT